MALPTRSARAVSSVRGEVSTGLCSTATATGAARFTPDSRQVFGLAPRGLAGPQTVLPEQAIEIDPVDPRRPRRRTDPVFVLPQQLFQVAPLEGAHPGLARLAQRLADVDRALRAGDRGHGAGGGARRREVAERHAALEVVAQLA